MRNEYHGQLRLVQVTGPAGGGTLDVNLQPPAGRNWLFYYVYVSHTDGANRDIYLGYTNGTNRISFAASTIATTAGDILEPFTTKNIRATNGVYPEVVSADTWTNRDVCYIRYAFADIGGS